MLTQLFIFILCRQFNDSYSYNCLIGDVEVDAVRNDETSLTCRILQDDVCQFFTLNSIVLYNCCFQLTSTTSSQVVGISIIWTGPSDLRHTIDSIIDSIGKSSMNMA